MSDGVKTTYEGFLRKVKNAGKRLTSVITTQRVGAGGDSCPKGIPLLQLYERVGVSLVEVCNRVGKSVISVAKGTLSVYRCSLWL